MNAPPAGVVLAVTGLTREARLLCGPGVRAIAGGGDSPGLASKLEQAMAEAPVAGVISIGLGGALAAELEVGDWVVADAIVTDDRRAAPTDPFWRDTLAERLARSGRARVRTGAIAGSPVMVVDASAKSDLHARTGALAVDMESHVAVRFAQAHAVPFAALRVISDGANRALPRAAQAGMRKDGGMDILAVLKSLAADPRQLPALIRTGREAGAAFRALRLLGRDDLLSGPGIGCPYLGQLLLDMP